MGNLAGYLIEDLEYARIAVKYADARGLTGKNLERTINLIEWLEASYLQLDADGYIPTDWKILANGDIEHLDGDNYVNKAVKPLKPVKLV